MYVEFLLAMHGKVYNMSYNKSPTYLNDVCLQNQVMSIKEGMTKRSSNHNVPLLTMFWIRLVMQEPGCGIRSHFKSAVSGKDFKTDV